MIHKCIDYIVLSTILLFHSLLNTWFIFKDTTPPEWDPSLHGILSLLYFRGSDILLTSDYYPPFFHLTITPIYALFGDSFDVACCVNILFLAILLFSIYGTGKILFNREAGLISALFISFIPILINFQRDLFIDFALISMVSLSIFLLLKTQNFKNINYSILFGIASGFTILTKWTAILFLMAPIIWTLYQTIKSEFSKAVKSNICGSSILFLLITYAWYIPNATIFRFIVTSQKHWGAVEGDPIIFSVSSLFYYIEAVNKQAYLIFSILALISMLFLLLKTDKDKKILFIISLLIPYIVFFLTRNKDIRYTIPLLIFLALSVGFTIASINSKKLKAGIIVALIIFGLVQTSTITFGYPILNTPNHIYPETNHPEQGDWKEEYIFNIILSDSNSSQDTQILMLYRKQHMNHWTLKYYAFLNNLPIFIRSDATLDENQTVIHDCDFIICQEKDTKESEKNKLKEYFIYKSIRDNFNLVTKVDIPNYEQMLIYKRK